MIKRITVLYDADCALCVRCRMWMGRQAALVEIEFLPAGSSEAAARFGDVPWLGEDLVVVSDRGEVWAGPAAFIVALWALERYREWSYRLSGDTLSKVAEGFFHALSGNRKWIAGWFGHPSCAGGSCKLPGAHAAGPFR
ncbi:DCC1-like thiol-disulfide oxidoreductase family protein [Sorangium sp. So ce406]|uniref:DCC1-like thiol-disulfide oxidoreductase family protein n=1 Tax=Sorangium sp. So ce406 TaxID=3133311 RepID=UPI003F5C1CE4